MRRHDLRVTDHERERAVAQLQRSCAHGAIGLDTLERRLVLAYGAETFGQLERATFDLPSRWRRLLARAGQRLDELRAVSGDAALPPPAAALTPPHGREAFVVGRDHRCALVFDEPTVSREHAYISRDGASGAWHVADLESTNGTWVNGRRVEQGRLRDGDVIALGQLVLKWDAPSGTMPG